jgi:ATP-dependent DNA helicase RecQ
MQDLSSAKEVLRQRWGYSSFRAGQEKAISSILSGKDTLVLFPTGGGKSLCYQVPALLFDGLTLVISPLIALMKDQVDQLKARGIRASYINSTLSRRETEQRLVNARNGMYKLLYIAPERIKTELWQTEQPNLSISLIAVDEAHCISEWGHDFRPSYRTIKQDFGELANQTRWMACTATATPEVRKDLLDVLQFRNPVVVTNGFSRENLHWWVAQTDHKSKMIRKSVKRASAMGSGIIYSSTRRKCESLASQFTKQGIGCKAYHAGLGNKEREDVQQAWLQDDIPLVAATNAFGMGIDKADCRFVIHETIPFSLEAYYQEAGRAGRDGKPAYPILIYKPSDVHIIKKRIISAYPDYETLQKVYDSLCDELNLALGSEMEQQEVLNFQNVAKRSGLPLQKVKLSIILLERLEILQKTDLREPRIGIRFVVGQQLLLDFIDRAAAEKGEFVDTIMRQAGPQAFHKKVFLKEDKLLDLMGITAHQLEKGLHVLSQHDQLLEFSLESEQSLLYLEQQRTKKLEIDKERAYRYKDILLEKLQYMVRYAETKECREVFLRNYFGETDCSPCGKCDNCLKKQSKDHKVLSREEIDKVENLLNKKDCSSETISRELKWDKNRTKRVISFMVREELIKYESKKGERLYSIFKR